MHIIGTQKRRLLTWVAIIAFVCPIDHSTLVERFHSKLLLIATESYSAAGAGAGASGAGAGAWTGVGTNTGLSTGTGVVVEVVVSVLRSITVEVPPLLNAKIPYAIAATRAMPNTVPTMALPELSVCTVVVGCDGGVIMVVIKLLLIPRGSCISSNNRHAGSAPSAVCLTERLDHMSRVPTCIIPLHSLKAGT